MIDRLHELPIEIENASIKLIELTSDLHEKTSDLKKSEMEMKLEIADALDANGKKLYSNAESREAALVEKMRMDESVVELQKTIKTVETSIQKIKVKVELLSNEQRNIRAIMQFIASGSTSNL